MREQQELSDDIVTALGQNTNPVDEEELENDLEALQQESLDEAMLKTGTVPSFPTPATQERKFFFWRRRYNSLCYCHVLTCLPF
jgi:charged multivesicular body protein 4